MMKMCVCARAHARNVNGTCIRLPMSPEDIPKLLKLLMAAS